MKRAVKRSLAGDDDARATRRRRILASLPDDMTLWKLASLDLDTMSLPDDGQSSSTKGVRSASSSPNASAAWKQQVVLSFSLEDVQPMITEV